MADTTAREQLLAQLRPLLPDGWQVVPSQRNYDDTQGVVVQLKLQSVARFPAAPIGGYLTSWVLTITTGQQDVERAEGDLDDALLEFLAALDAVNRSLWTSAVAVADGNRLGYDVALTIQTTKDPEGD